MTLTQTVDIPENRLLHLDWEIPREIPSGKAQIELKVIPFPVKKDTQISSVTNVSTEEALASAREIIEKYRPAFEALAK